MKPTDNLSRNTRAVADTLTAMMQSEFTSYSYNEEYLNPSDPTMITADDRMKLADWCYNIVDHCRFSRETVASAMEMVDRFLSMPSNSVDAARVSDEALRDQSKLQLLTVAALYISIKLNEKTVISSEALAEMCRLIYSAQEIEDMERTLLSGLSWRCHAPTAHQVGLSILSLLLPYVDMLEATWGFLMDEMKYKTELAVRDYYFSTQRTSTIALAAIFNAINEAKTTTRNKDLLGAFVRVTMECYDFDHPLKIAAVRSRLQGLANKEKKRVEGDNMDDEVSVEDSVKTRKVSNRSSSRKQQKRRSLELEGHAVSPSSSLHDICSKDQDLYDLSSGSDHNVQRSLHFC